MNPQQPKRQADEIREALLLTKEHSYEIHRTPRDRKDLFGQKIVSFVCSDSVVTIVTEVGETLSFEFVKFRLSAPSGTITLFPDNDEEKRLIEFHPERFTAQFIELLGEVSRRLNWPSLRSA